MQLKSRRAAEFINEMVALELIEPTMPFENKAAFPSALRKSDPLVLARSDPGQEQHRKR